MIWLTQLLCPFRHAIMAAAGDCEDEAAAAQVVERPLRETVERLIGSGAMAGHCGLCGSEESEWRWETRRTEFKTMAEAKSALEVEAAKQAVTRAFFGDLQHKQRPN